MTGTDLCVNKPHCAAACTSLVRLGFQQVTKGSVSDQLCAKMHEGPSVKVILIVLFNHAASC